ncbi:hypothetical protein [Streptomyces sp. NPDC092952]|uniref:hypothetical protein n=1 Tax=Streptomyces sp. NPDC092952 TaxID=3366018 RepID=UPI0037F89688
MLVFVVVVDVVQLLVLLVVLDVVVLLVVLIARGGDVSVRSVSRCSWSWCAEHMGSSSPTPEYGAPALPVMGARQPQRSVDRQPPGDDPVTELRAALVEAQKWLMYAAGREAADNPAQAALLVQASADIGATLKRTAAGVVGRRVGDAS